VVHKPGATVEVLGLRHWTPAMIQDTMDVRAPGESLTSHACAATLKGKLGFPEAIAVRFRGDSATNVLVALIEPQDSALVKKRVIVEDTTRSLAPWAPLVTLARTQPGVLQMAVLAHVQARGVGLAPVVPASIASDSAAVREVWAYLDAHRSGAEAAAAQRVLRTSPNVYDRIAAVAVLASFDHEDATWHALVGALLDPQDRVRILASALSRSFTLALPRRVDWRPAAAELHAVLNGSALFALHEVLDMLVATGVERELAAPLLKGGGHAVVMYAGSEKGWARGPAYRFLRAVSGQDLGGTPANWRAWIQSL
jgi:hypothetical protein